MIVLFEVSPLKIVRDAPLFGWDLAELTEGKIKIIFTTRSVLQQELQQADSLLLAEAGQIGARRMFIDAMPPLPRTGTTARTDRMASIPVRCFIPSSRACIART